MSYKIIRPRHGIKSLWEAYKSRIYKQGEMLVESPESGVGSGPVNIKFGDGVTDYENLPYAVLAPTSEIAEGSKAPITSGAVYDSMEELNSKKSELSSPGYSYTAFMQEDGNLVIYDSDETPVFSTVNVGTMVENHQTRFDNLALYDAGAYDMAFSNGVGYTLSMSFNDVPPKYGQLRGVIVNGFGTGHHFVASISDASVSGCGVVIRCVSDPTLTGTERISLTYIFTWVRE